MGDYTADAIAPSMWSNFMRDSYHSRRPPVTGSVDVKKVEEAAREKLKNRLDAFNYVFGNAGTHETFHANRKELNKWKVIPRQLRDVTYRSIETTIFGVKYSSPLFLAPIGVHGIVHPDGELATAAAARELGVPMILSTVSSRSIEAVAEANGSGPRWFQLYWPLVPEMTLSLMKRAKNNGYSALVVTVDTMSLGWRPHDIDTAYLPFYHAVGAQIALTDPEFMQRYGLEPYAHDDVPEFPYDPAKFDELVQKGDKKALELLRLGDEWMGQLAEGVYRTWDELAFIRKNWDGPLVLKGILSVEDAELAIDAGMDGIIVSNHGGRQIDGAIPCIWALEKICQSPKVKAAQRSGRFTILTDSGIRTGTDIFRAIAIGAQGVLLGRSYIYGLAIGGQVGVETVVKSILAEFEITLGLCGYKSVSEIWGRAGEVMVKID
ncbi:FMN-dependent alpha-hydroxy acid dehydrogenase [Pilatotrama ljubarskyi]|nr:FMN-dependent alpha-hydroxy acid dehydrogenase [Pilatotrama ljubarskyi]